MVNFDDDEVDLDESGWGWCKPCFQVSQKRTWAPLVNSGCSDCQQKQKQSSGASSISSASIASAILTSDSKTSGFSPLKKSDKIE